MRVTDENKGAGKSVVLFLHGWGAKAELYRPIIDNLSRNFRVIAPDMAGFGDSEEPHEPWCTDDYVDQLQELLAELKVNSAILMGHSHGGRVVVNWLSRAAQPVEVKKAVLFAPACLRPPRGLSYYVKVYSYKLGKLFLKPFPVLLERFTKNKGSSDYKNASPVMRRTMSRMLSEDYKPRLREIKADILLIFGENDTAVPLRHGEIMEREIPSSGLVKLTGASHWGLIEQSNYVNSILGAFLK